jgi:hypothetical protein
MIGRILLAGACLLGLGGCNSVVSMEPWFTAADAQGAPKFREGLWLRIDNADCRFNVASPVERWPDCAQASLVRGDERLAIEWEDPKGPRRRQFVGWRSDPTLVANGDPLIAQVDWQGETQDSAPGPSDVVVDEAASEELPWRFLYYAMRPTGFDEQGRVLEFESWGIRCGPPPEPTEDPDEAEGNVTEQPFPGLTVRGDNCTAESVDALRRAVTLSEPLEPHGTARWVRDGWR